MNVEQYLLKLSSYCQFQQMLHESGHYKKLFQKVQSLTDHALASYKLAVENNTSCYLLICADILVNILNIIKESPVFSGCSDIFLLAEQAYDAALKLTLRCSGNCSCRQKDAAILKFNNS